jgi:hypothetical protein
MSSKTTAFAIAILLSFPVLAQFEKGDRMVGAGIGSLVFNSGTADVTVSSVGSTTSQITGYNININPSMGWFVSEKTVVGVSLVLNPTSQKTTFEENSVTFQMDKNSGFNIGLGGFVRNYFGSSGSFLPFGQASLNLGIANLKTEGFYYGASPLLKRSYKGSSNGGFFANAALTGGLTKMLGDNIGLDLYLGYNFSYNKNEFKRTTLVDLGNDGSVDESQTNETTTKFTNHGFMLGAGFQIFLRGKKK